MEIKIDSQNELHMFNYCYLVDYIIIITYK